MKDGWGNEWTRCLPVTAVNIGVAEAQCGLKIPADLITVILACNGGKPTRTYFQSKDIEVELGQLLPIDPPKGFKNQKFVEVNLRLRKTPYGGSLLAFGVDAGNAGFYVWDTIKNGVYYWVEEDNEDPLTFIAESLDQFFSGLAIPPY